MATTVQAILQEHYAQFAATHPLAAYQRAAAAALRDCRTAAMGGHWCSCPNGHVHTVHYNSCHHRNCPLCAALAREKWLVGWNARLLDCSHAHTVFTTPQDLVPLWRYNKALFAGELFHAATDALRELLADPQYMGGLPGMLAGLHTWSQQLAAHIHLHVLLTWGGLTPDGEWVEPQKSCLLPRKVLMEKFRGKLQAYLRKALDAGRLVLPPDMSPARARSILNRVGRIVWNVKILERYEHGQGVATYLARYLKGGPIHNGRLVDCRDGVVRFWYQDNRKQGDSDEHDGRGRRKLLPLPVGEFLRRLLEHVPPPEPADGAGLRAVRQRQAGPAGPGPPGTRPAAGGAAAEGQLAGGLPAAGPEDGHGLSAVWRPAGGPRADSASATRPATLRPPRCRSQSRWPNRRRSRSPECPPVRRLVFFPPRPAMGSRSAPRPMSAASKPPRNAAFLPSTPGLLAYSTRLRPSEPVPHRLRPAAAAVFRRRGHERRDGRGGIS